MTIPFLDLFKKAKARLGKQTEPQRMLVPRAPLPEKTAAERLSKTVMPNTTRTVGPIDPFEAAAGGKGRTRDMPTPLTPTPEPRERAISLTLADIVEHLPAGSLKPSDTFDGTRTITINAAEVEKGMATGQPTALLTSIYEQIPDIFRQSVESTDLTTVSLPLQKVLEQFQTLQVRDDQMQDEDVPQVETPFLQVTIEDTKKFGTSLAPLQTSAKPPVKVEPATARAFAKAEPEPVAQQKQSSGVTTRRPITLNPKTGPAPAPTPPTPPSPPPAAPDSGPTRIPFKLPPNGAGVPASERVPASSGPPVPTPPSAPPKSAPPTRIPFKMTPPNATLKPKLTLVPGVEPAESEAMASTPPSEPVPTTSSAKADDVAVRLRLNICFRNLPAFQLSGPLPEIPDDVSIELPYSVIEPQLASGRVAINPKLFNDAIPEKFRELFVVDATETPVLLPLQEVLQHLPTTALVMRQDQEQEEAINQFETPFSFHAKEDQKRFGKPDGEAAKPAESKAEAPTAEPVTVTEPAKAEKSEEQVAEAKVSKSEKSEVPPAPPSVEAEVEGRAPATPVNQKTEEPAPATEKTKVPAQAKEEAQADQTAPTTPSVAAAEAKNNAKEFVLRVTCMPGIVGCSIGFADGLTMAGNLPPNLGVDGLCAVAPSVLQKIEKHMIGTDLGSLNLMTLHCGKSPLSFFMQGNVCLTVLHSEQNLEPVTQEQLVEMTKELAQMFAQPETTNVDH